jgi:hypothetical protein
LYFERKKEKKEEGRIRKNKEEKQKEKGELNKKGK